MRTPPVGLLLLVFIGKHRFKGAAMQVEGHDIGGSERVLRQMGEKEFVDNAMRGEPTRLFFLAAGWVATMTRQRRPRPHSGHLGQS